MNRPLAVLLALTVAVLGQSPAHGQKQTERYIPLGQSPGLSGKLSRIGTVDAVNQNAKTLTFATPEGRYGATVTPRTRIWIDRSKQQQTTRNGTFQDVQLGRRVEVKYEGAEPRGNAEWIKLE